MLACAYIIHGTQGKDYRVICGKCRKTVTRRARAERHNDPDVLRVEVLVDGVIHPGPLCADRARKVAFEHNFFMHNEAKRSEA
jgi:hypothetical protein